MKRLARKYLAYQSFRAVGRPRPLPVSVAYSVTHRCNARCKTCGVADAPLPDMDTDAWLRVFRSLGRAPAWITVTGGEPFMRPDIADLLRAMLRSARPSFLTVATNGFFTRRIVPALHALARDFPDTDIIANISLDGIGAQHDRVRGLDGSFDAAMDTYHGLCSQQFQNLHAGFHTVISTFNAENVPDLIRYAAAFKPSAHGFEIAQSRAELNMQDKQLAPSAQTVRALLPELKRAAAAGPDSTPVQGVRRAFRAAYYDLALHCLDTGCQPVPCCAGTVSAYIAPDGGLWACPTAASCMGSLPDAGFEFKSVWRSATAARVRRGVANGECSCVLANALFTSMLMDPAAALRVAARSGGPGLAGLIFK
jgi:MoaA/NifB/PqqE/SkfB family radical SAM enzyme